jgi:hypothetical protein
MHLGEHYGLPLIESGSTFGYDQIGPFFETVYRQRFEGNDLDAASLA